MSKEHSAIATHRPVVFVLLGARASCLERRVDRTAQSEVLNETVRGASRQTGAVFFLDLDGFKQVNDVYGHETGDIVLQEVAQTLATVRPRTRRRDGRAVRR